jgi:hypothetical protein
MKKNILTTLAIGASCAAFAQSANLTATTDSSNPALWSDGAKWSTGEPVNDIATQVLLKLPSSGDVGYISVDDNYSCNSLYANTTGEFHISVAEGKNLTAKGATNSLFFTNKTAAVAQVYFDSGTMTQSGAVAIYLPKDGDSVTFGAGTNVNLGTLKIRTIAGEDHQKYVAIAGTASIYGFEIYANSASGGSANFIVYSTGNVTAQTLKVDLQTAGNNTDVGSAAEIYGTMQFTASGQSSIQGYALGNSDATFSVKSGGTVSFTNAGAADLLVKAVSNANAGTVLEVQNGGTFSAANNVSFYGNSANTNRAVGVINGTFSAKNLNIDGDTMGRVDVGSTGSITVASNVNIGTGTTANASVLNIAGGTMTVASTLNVRAGSTLNVTGGSLIVNGITNADITARLNVSGTGTVHLNSISQGYKSVTPGYQFFIGTSGNTFGDYIYFIQGGGIAFSASNDLSGTDLLYRGGATRLLVSDNSTLEIAGIFLHGTVKDKVTLITIESGSKLIVGSTGGTASYLPEEMASLVDLTNNNCINIIGFEEGSIAFKEIGDSAAQAAALSHIKLDGAYSEDLRFSDFDGTVGGYWLTTAPIPEPATWAAIFGAVALGFAAYRRRK